MSKQVKLTWHCPIVAVKKRKVSPKTCETCTHVSSIGWKGKFEFLLAVVPPPRHRPAHSLCVCTWARVCVCVCVEGRGGGENSPTVAFGCLSIMWPWQWSDGVRIVMRPKFEILRFALLHSSWTSRRRVRMVRWVFSQLCRWCGPSKTGPINC